MRPTPYVIVRPLKLLLAMLIGLFAAVAGAQRLPAETIDSLDVQVIRSSHISVGTVASITTSETGRFPKVSFEVKETLRGDASGVVSGETIYPEHRWQPPSEPKARDLQNLSRAKAPVLILDRPSGQLRIIDLESPNPVVSTADFRLLKSPEEILRFVREVIKHAPMNENLPTVALDPPSNARGKAWKAAAGYHGLGGLIVPVDNRSERQVLRLLSHVTKINYYGIAGKIIPFKSDANIARMRALLKDPEYEVVIQADKYNGMEYRDFPKRMLAQRVLKEWKVPFDEPEVRTILSKKDSITSLETTVGGEYGPDVKWLDEAPRLTQLHILYGQLSEDDVAAIARHTQLTDLAIPRTHLNDATLRRFLRLKNLRSLNVDFDSITDEGLQALVTLPNLKELSVANTNVTEEGLRAFAAARPDVKVNTKAKDGE